MNDIFFLIPNWKWIGLLVGFVLGFIVKTLSRHIILYIKTKHGSNDNIPTPLKHFITCEIHFPLAWLLAAGTWHLSLQILAFHESFEKIAVVLIHLLALVNIMRLAYMAVEAAGKSLEDYVSKSSNSLDSQLAPFATKVLKIVVIGFGILLSLQSLGFNVAAVLAGLGIGSLALALAAQDTAANLFGSITIILDRPFKVGDYIKVGDTEGTVEEVGFRSTQIRTPGKSIITVPNSTMAKEKIDNLGARPSRRFKHLIGIASWTPPTKVVVYVNHLRDFLNNHPLVKKDEITVYFQSIGDFDFKININCYFETDQSDIELQAQQDLLLKFIEIAAANQIELPYPTRTIYTRQI
jgi:MscS family membrane protein